MLALSLLAAATLATGDDLLAACVAPESQRTACSAMVIGVANGAMLASQDLHQPLLCLRIGLRPGDLIETVRKYLDAHPEDRSKPAPLLTYRALKEQLSCPHK